MMTKLAKKLRFRPTTLPIDKSGVSGARPVRGAVFAEVTPTPIEKPVLVMVSQSALDLLEISHPDSKSDEFLQIFSGNQVLPESQPLAHCYCGFQFGVFAGQLGDGAALLLGTTASGWDVGLKGSGLTPFSRRADGRKVLRSSLREFLGSEAMHALGVPTTRAASLVVSELSQVWRDVRYDGHPRQEKCAVISRLARTFFRFGSFEISRGFDSFSGQAGPSVETPEIVLTLLNHVKRELFEDCSIEEFVRQVTTRTAELVAHWQSIGFVHGVLNTDNMSVIGDTMDYGPFAFMEYFDSDLVANTTDRTGMYSFSQQPRVCRTNCLLLADSIEQVLGRQEEVSISERLTEIVDQTFGKVFETKYRQLMKRKLRMKEGVADSEVDEVVVQLQELMRDSFSDFTTTFYLLGGQLTENTASEILDTCAPEMLRLEMVKYKSSVQWDRPLLEISWISFIDRLKLLQDPQAPNVNPKFILRNYLMQRAIELAETGDYSGIQRLMESALKPFDPTHPDDLLKPQPAMESCTSLSCSS